jgi:hypothetical protein
MAATTITAEALLSREQLRTFHLAGPGAGDSTSWLRPTVLGEFKDLPQFEASYPMCVNPGGGARPFREVVNELEHAGNITSAFRTAMEGQPAVPLSEITDDAIATLGECSPAEISRLRKLLPAGAYLAAFHVESLVLLHAAALAESRREQRAKFWDDVRHTAARLRELLALDEAHGPAAISSESVSASLGSQVGSFFNADRLANALRTPKNPLRRMDADRRARCETTLAMLDEGIHDNANEPAFWLFHAGIFGSTNVPSEILLFNGYAKWAVDTFAAAQQFCDSRLERLTILLRALRVARLEIDSTFDPVVHEEMLARFDWESATAAELNALPPIVVIETAGNFGQASLSSFGRLLRSGRPIQILIQRGGLDEEDINAFSPDFGFVSIAHRESFVLQSSMAQPAHLLPGLKAMAKTLRPAVAVVSTPRPEEEERGAWVEDSLLVLSRAIPLYIYDPDAGPRWADRYRLLPQTGDLTAVHAAAVSPRLQNQFRVIPASAWNDDQIELAQYLEAYTDRPPLAIPYIWVKGANGTQQRALVTRDLVNFCIDRRRAWALFEELAEASKPKPVVDENARQEGAKEAIQKVLAMLATA